MERAILRNRDFTLIAGRTDRTETARDPDHLLAILDAHFGLPFRASRNRTSDVQPSGRPRDVGDTERDVIEPRGLKR